MRRQSQRDCFHAERDSISPRHVQSIARQEEHHRKIGFQDELRAWLRKHEIEWDEKYVWD
jgi:hypothetical protein